ncbi:MAG: glycosyltransferase [Bryobacterales bacterium]|nr:glycosyltransferase [Bryobacterales bacterium]
MNLLVVSHVAHYRCGGSIHAYEPYAREIEAWADLFSPVVIAAPCTDGQPAKGCASIRRSNVRLVPQPQAGGDALCDKVRLAWSLPRMVYGLSCAMWRAEAIHVRCPCNFGLLGAILAPLFSRRLIAKYAGDWRGFPKEPWTFRLQRCLLSSSWWHGPVTVYGDWPNQPAHVVPFFSASITDNDIARARTLRDRELSSPLHVVYAGRLTLSKNVGTILDAIALLKDRGIPVRCTIAGDGPMRDALAAKAARHAISDAVSFSGALPFEHFMDLLASADVLALTSNTEGWPKVLPEAMAFGVICISTCPGGAARLLSEGRGISVPKGDVNGLAAAIEDIATHPERYNELRHRAALWSEQYTVETLRERLRQLTGQYWTNDLRAAPGIAE